MEPTHGRWEVDKFDGEGDFSIWKHRVLAQIEILGLDSVLKADGASSDPEDAAEGDKSDPKWVEKDRRVRNLLSMSVTDMVLRKVMKHKTAQSMWNALESQYQDKSLPNRFYLKQRFYSFKMEEGKNLDKNLDVFNKLVSELASLEVELSDEDQAVILLNSLPSHFAQLVHTLKYRGTGTMTLKEITTSAYSLETEMKQKGNYLATTSNEGLFIQSRGRPENRTEKKKNVPRGKSKQRSKSRPVGKRVCLPVGKRVCWICGIEGHFKKDCPKKPNGEAAVAKAESSEPIMLTASEKHTRDGWVLDSGCSYHLTFNKNLLFDVEEVNGGKILMGNDTYCEIAAIGKLKIVNHNKTLVVLTNVRYSPTARRNLISLGQLEQNGCWFQSRNYRLQVFQGDKEVLAGDYLDTLYMLDGKPELEEVNAAVKTEDKTALWHSRLGHMSAKGLQLLVKKEMIKSGEVSDLNRCEHCILGKSHKLPFKTGKHTSEGPLEYVHSDLWGSPNVTPSLSKCHYYISFVDDYSRKVWVYFLRTKDEAFKKFVEWKAFVENQSGKKLKALRTDNGLEYCNKTFDDHCKLHGIMRHKTCPYTPQQNGIAERLNRTILEKVRSLLSETGLGESFWAEATSTVVYMINRTPSTPLNFEIPEEVWSGRRPDYSHMKRFGCLVYYHVEQGKLRPRAKKGVFMGYPQGVKGYRIWNGEEKRCVISRDVIFCEDVVYKDFGKIAEEEKRKSKSDGKKKVKFSLPTDQFVEQQPLLQGESSAQGGAISESHEGVPESEDDSDAENSPQDFQDYLLARDRERRNIKPPSRFDDANVAAYALVMADLIEEEEPRNYQEAISGSNKLKWTGATKEEMDSLIKNHTWDLIQRPEGHRTIGCKWLFKLKPGIPGVEEARYKARLVAKGFSQIEGIDYNEVFSPVVKHTTIRLMLSIVVNLDLELEQLDVKTAFLHGSLDERILMEQPEGFAKDDRVCLLRRSLYGLKQASRQWNLRFDQFMKAQDFTRSQFDPCVYFKLYAEDSYVYLLLYVDDMLVAAKDLKEIQRLKAVLSKDFEMKDLGPAKRILGMDIIRDRSKGVLMLSQKAYVEKILRNFGMTNSKPVSTPMGCHFRLSSTKQEDKAKAEAEMRDVPYSSAVGSLMYAMVCSRPDIAHAVGLVSRFMSAPSMEHWDAVRWILRYIRGTSNLKLMFIKTDNLKVVGYCDSDYAADLDRRRSITGYAFQVGGNTVSWRSGLQQTVSLSTTEAEYMALTEAGKEAIWLSGITEELGFPQKVVEIFCDSQSAICLAKNSTYHERTKHMAVRMSFIREVVEEGLILVTKIDTKLNPADMLTKSLPVKKLEEGRSHLRVLRD